MTHPSLAQRLRAIRDAAGIGEPEVAEFAVLAADASDRAVVLAPDRLFWLAGIPAASLGSDPDALRDAATDRRSTLYTDLTDLRLYPLPVVERILRSHVVCCIQDRDRHPDPRRRA